MSDFVDKHNSQLQGLNIPPSLFESLDVQLRRCFVADAGGTEATNGGTDEVSPEALVQRFRENVSSYLSSNEALQADYGSMLVIPHLCSWDMQQSPRRGLWDALQELPISVLQDILANLKKMEPYHWDIQDLLPTEEQANSSERSTEEQKEFLLNEICNDPSTWSRVILYRHNLTAVRAALPAPPFFPQIRYTEDDIDTKEADITGPFPFQYYPPPAPHGTDDASGTSVEHVIDCSLAYLSPGWHEHCATEDGRKQLPTIDLVPSYSVPNMLTRCVRYAALLGPDMAPEFCLARAKEIYSNFVHSMHLVRQKQMEEIADAKSDVVPDADADADADAAADPSVDASDTAAVPDACANDTDAPAAVASDTAATVADDAGATDANDAGDPGADATASVTAADVTVADATAADDAGATVADDAAADVTAADASATDATASDATASDATADATATTSVVVSATDADGGNVVLAAADPDVASATSGEDGKVLKVYTDSNDPMKLSHPVAGLSPSSFVVTNDPEEADIIYSFQSLFAPGELKDVLDRRPNVLINQFPFEGALVQKDHLAREIWNQHGLPLPDWAIESYDLDVQLGEFVGSHLLAANRLAGEETADKNVAPLWIIKPSHGTRSQGHVITRSAGQVMRLLDSGGGSRVAQRYIENPVCYDRRKVDCRCLVMMTSASPPGKPSLFIHNRVYFRRATKPHQVYRPCDLLDEESLLTAMHLLSPDTGDSNDNSGASSENKFEKLPLDVKTIAKLEQDYGDVGFDWKGSVLPQIHTLIRELFSGMTKAYPGMGESTNSRGLYGIDVIFEVEGTRIQPKLTEVSFCSSNNAICDDYERDDETYRNYNTDVFNCLFLGKVNERITQIQ